MGYASAMPDKELRKSLERITTIAELALDRNEKLQAFLDASPWGILVLDPDFQIVFMNSPLERMTGWTLSELAYRPLSALIPRKMRKTHSKHEKDFKNHPRTRYGDHPFEPQLLRKDGTTLEVEISLAPSEVDGKPFFFASIRPRETLEN